MRMTESPTKTHRTIAWAGIVALLVGITISESVFRADLLAYPIVLSAVLGCRLVVVF